jgi:hypothetical protein
MHVGALVVLLCLCGCGGEPYTYEPNSELKTGPGLLSGEDGKITIYKQRPAEEKEEEHEKE